MFPSTWASAPGATGDIALIKLKKNVTYTNTGKFNHTMHFYIRFYLYEFILQILLSLNVWILLHKVSPVCLPWKQPSTEFTGRTGVTVGWGTTEDGDTSDTLRKVMSN